MNVSSQVRGVGRVFEEELEHTLQRVRRGADILLSGDEPVVGATPKDVIHSRGTLRLYRFRPATDEVYRVPVIFVMSLISRTYIVDLTPGQSLVEFLLNQGFDVYQIDWGEPRPGDERLRLEDYVLDFIPDCLEKVRQETGEQDASLVGYCMGGQFSVMYAGLFPEAPIANIVCIATPANMAGMGLFRQWMDPRWFDVDRVVDAFGNVPPDFIFRSFEMLRPLDRWVGYVRLWDNLWDEAYVQNYRVLNKWVHEQIPFPGETFRQMTRDLMWANKLMTGELELASRRVEPQKIRAPFLHVMAEHDHIAPIDATRPLSSLIGSDDKNDIVLKGGHVSLIAGPRAVLRLWPALSQWLAVRSV